MKSKMKRTIISKAIRIYIILTMISHRRTEMTTVPHAKCTPKYFFGCNDEEKLTIGSFKDGPYSVEDCYELCSKTTSCVGFNFGPAQHCILKEKGCSKDNQKTTHGFYFAMEKCKRYGFGVGPINTLCREEKVIENYLDIHTSHWAKAKKCRTAAKELFGIEPYSTDIYITNPNMPKGCYLDTRKTTAAKVKYNKHEIGSKNKNARPICIID